MGIPGAIADIQPFAELAQNATTLVFKAYQKSLERFVLLKRLRPELSSDQELAHRFQEEARIVARVQHPNVVGIYAYGNDDEGAYIVAEFVEGLDLEEVIARDRIHPEIAVYILLECARGLKAAHDRDVLHRDIKPSNVLVSFGGEVKLADFGLASILGTASEAAEVRGTLAYLAPEQILGKPVDKRSDLFSLGATFFEMLTGRRAFPGSTSSEIFDAIVNREPLHYLPATPGVDAGVESVVRRLLAREPEDRYADAGDLIRDLESWSDRVGAAHGSGAATRADLVAYLDDPAAFSERRPVVIAPVHEPMGNGIARPAVPVSRRRRLAAVMAGALLVVATVLYAGILMVREDRPQRQDLMAAADSTEPAGTPASDSTLAEGGLMDHDEETPTAAVTDSISDDAGRLLSESDRPPEKETPASEPDTDSRRVERNASVVEEEAQEGRVELTVDAPADVFVGDKPVGRAVQNRSLVVELPEGRHVLTFKNPDYPAYPREVTVRPGETTKIEVSLRSLVGYLEIQVSPYARVYVDGEDYGDTPFAAPIILLPGVHKLRLVHEQMGFDRTFDIRIVAGQTFREQYRLFDLR